MSTPTPIGRVIYAAHPSSEWYTPRPLRELAHEVLGAIDLDPATDARNPLRAKHAITVLGLESDWTSVRPRSIWLNPPYGRDIGKWIKQLTSTLAALPGAKALALVPCRPGARWYARATDPRGELAAQLLCELTGRVTFELPDGSPAEHAARWGCALLYWGADRAAVARQLRRVGIVRMCACLPRELCGPRAADRRQLQLVC